MRVFYLISLLFYLLPTANSQSNIVVPGDYSKIIIGEQAMFHCDSSRTKTIEEVHKLDKTYFQKNPKNGLITPATSYNYWLKFTIESTKEMTSYLLVKNSNNDRLIFYEMGVDGRYKKSKNYGDLLDVYHRDFAYENPIYELELKKGVPKTIYIEFWSYTVPSRLPLELLSQKELIREISYEHIKLGLLIGILFIFIIITIYNFIFSKNYMQIYLLIVILGTSLYIFVQSGLGLYYIWTPLVYYNSTLMDLSALLVYTSMVLMLKSYLNLAKYLPNTNYVLSIILIISPIIYVLISTGFYIFPEHYFSPFNDFAASYYLSVNLFFFYVIIRSYLLSRKWQTFLFFIANSAYFFAVVIYNIVQFVPVPSLLYDNAYWLILIYILNLLFLFSYNQTQAKKLYDLSQKELIIQKEQAVNNLVLGQIQERKRLSQELHDGVSTMLANIKMRLSGLFSEIPNLEKDTRKISIEKDINDLSIDIRKYSHNLRPTILVERGLEESIHETIYKFEMAHPNIDFEFEKIIENKIELPITIQHALYFCQTEILNNIMKHGKEVDKIKICLELTLKQVSLIVSDNGNGGFNLVEDNKGIGIGNIQNRVGVLNGHFNIEEDKNGVYHIIIIPLH